MRSVRLLAVVGLVGLVAALLVAGPPVAADEPKLTQEESEKIVHDYLLREPEVLAEASVRPRVDAAGAVAAEVDRHAIGLRGKRGA
jgi:uncharacterized protein YciI